MQESIREAIENARLPDSDLEYIQRYWAEETEKASEEAKALAKKQVAHRDKVRENRKRRKVDSTPPSTEQTPTPSSGDTDNSENLRAEIDKLKQDLAKLAGNAGRGRGRGRGRGQSHQSRSNSRDRVPKKPSGPRKSAARKGPRQRLLVNHRGNTQRHKYRNKLLHVNQHVNISDNIMNLSSDYPSMNYAFCPKDFSLVAEGNFKYIRHTFPVRGHSYLPNDRDFGRTEVSKRKNERVYTPEQWMSKC